MTNRFGIFPSASEDGEEVENSLSGDYSINSVFNLSESKLVDDLFAEQSHRCEDIFLPEPGGPVKTGQHVGDPKPLLVLGDLVDAFFRRTEDKAVLGQPVENPAQFTGIAHRLVLLPLDVDGTV